MDRPAAPHGLNELEGVAAATGHPLIQVPVPFVKKLIAYVRALEAFVDEADQRGKNAMWEAMFDGEG